MSEPEQKWMLITCSDDIFRWQLLCWYTSKKNECPCPHHCSDWQPHSVLKHCVHPHCAMPKDNSHIVDNSANNCNCRFRTEVAT